MQSPPLQPQLRKLKKGDQKDKLKNRMSMAFRKPFASNKAKSPEPTYTSPPNQFPPAYSAAAPSQHRPVNAPSIDPPRRHSGSNRSGLTGRSNKPQPQPSDGLVSRRGHVGGGAVGTSPPLPPLPRNGSIEGPTDPRVSALLGGADLQASDLLPHNSFGPAFEVPSIEGLGIGIETLHHPPPVVRTATPPAKLHQRQPSPPQPARSPPPLSYSQPQLRVHSPPPQQQPQQLQHSRSSHELRTPPQAQMASPPQPQLGLPPVLARPSTAPEEPQLSYVNRRMSMLASGGETSAASKRLSMMRRGPPPIFSSSSANSSSTTLETAAATAAQAVEQLAAQEKEASPPSAHAKVLLDEDEVGGLSDASRNRIAKLRTARASISAETPTAQMQVNPMRGANRKDMTKAYTLAAAPQGFDVSLIKPRSSTFTPIKPLPAAATTARPSPLSQALPIKATTPPVVPPAAPKKDLSMYVLRPMVDMSTQTPNWSAFSRRTSRNFAASTPPQAYSAFPAPPPPPHDSPPQRQISPSIYSVASFDMRSRAPRNKATRSSFYANGADPNEEDEYEYDEEDEPPLPDESADHIERHIAAFEEELYTNGYGPAGALERPEVVEEPVNYDIPYLAAEPFDTPHLRPFEILATPAAPLNIPKRAEHELIPSPSLTADGAATPTGELTPSVTPTPYAAPTFSTPRPFDSTSSLPVGALDIPESPRSSSSRSPSPAPDSVPGLTRSLSTASSAVSASTADDSSARPHTPDSLRRSSAELSTPPTSAVSSTFPMHDFVPGADLEATANGIVEPDTPIVTIRKASIVTSQVRKASLVTPPSSRPQSVVLRKGSLASLGAGRRGSDAPGSPRERPISTVSTDSAVSASSVTSNGSASGRQSPRTERSPRMPHFQLDLPGAGEVPPIPAVPSPIRREFGEAAFPFPLLSEEAQRRALAASEEEQMRQAVVESPVEEEEQAALVKEVKIVSPKASYASSPTESQEPTPSATPFLGPAPSDEPTPLPVVSAVDFDSIRPASAPPEESATLPLRRQSESDKPIPRARTPGARGMMSREERAARGRSYFLVQALMGEAQPEGMIRDWAKTEEDSDDDVSILGGGSSSEDEELSDFE
ncbi:hypothetical protein JCM10207_006651 [Rhodosporidiobolus poonsookiae]